MRVDQDKLQTLCMRLLGRPLEQPLRFMLRPFSTELERIWRRTLQYLWSDDEGSLPLTVAARKLVRRISPYAAPASASPQLQRGDSGDPISSSSGTGPSSRTLHDRQRRRADYRLECCGRIRREPAFSAGWVSPMARNHAERIPQANPIGARTRSASAAGWRS